MSLKFEKEGEDLRGKYIHCSLGPKKISIFEIKKGQARGGYSWEKEILQSLLSGKVEYRTTKIETKEEKITLMTTPSCVILPSNTSDLIIALDDSLMVEIHENVKKGIVYAKYRKDVEKRIQSKN